MFFSSFKGIKPVKGWLGSVFILSATAQVVSLVGFLDGFTGAEFDGRAAPLIYGAVLLGTWAGALVYLVKSKERGTSRSGPVSCSAPPSHFVRCIS